MESADGTVVEVFERLSQDSLAPAPVSRDHARLFGSQSSWVGS